MACVQIDATGSVLTVNKSAMCPAVEDVHQIPDIAGGLLHDGCPSTSHTWARFNTADKAEKRIAKTGLA